MSACEDRAGRGSLDVVGAHWMECALSLIRVCARAIPRSFSPLRAPGIWLAFHARTATTFFRIERAS